MIIVALDPSGNWGDKEGWGTTGLALYEGGNVSLHEIKSSDYSSHEEYWNAVITHKGMKQADYIVIEGYKLYNHAGRNAQMQSNSDMPTSQLIGALKMQAFHNKIPAVIQYASDVKTRWSDEVLTNLGILESGNKFKGKSTNAHKRDALRHLCHFKKYKLKDGK